MTSNLGVTETPLEPIPKSDEFVRCYGCGPANDHGLQMDFALDRGNDRVEATWRTPAFATGYGRMVHGGVISTMLDEAMGWALWGLLRKIGVTAEMTVRFSRPLFIGKTYIVRGSVARSDATSATVDAVVLDRRGRTLAEGTGEFRFVALERVRDS